MAHYEYRRYDVTFGKMDQLLNRFEDTTLKVWEDVGIRAIGFWETEIGRHQELHYVLAWDSLDERAEHLRAFRSDPRWTQARSESEREGPLIRSVESQLWTPTRFSPLS